MEPCANAVREMKPADILVVDDTVANIALLTTMLKNKGYRIRPVTSGELALKQMEKEPTDLILLDINMPGMSGFEVCAKLKADNRFRDIPVIFISALSETFDKVKAFSCGGVDYITKPFQWEEVEARIETHLALKSLADSLRDEIAERRLAQEALRRNQRQLEELNSELEQRVAFEVRKNREKDLALNAELAIRVAVEVEKNRQKDLKLMQSERMSAIGKLAAGVAHEINNPICFVFNNLQILTKYYDKLVEYDHLLLKHADALAPPAREIIDARRKSLDLEYILSDGVDLIAESLDGAERVSKIVRDLKSFSRVDKPEFEPTELSGCLESALNICSHELQSVATIRKEYTRMPEICCHPGELNQVFLNLLLNAGQAITPPGEIVLSCRGDGDFVYASVSDTGTGIPPEILGRIFEPFFTTKDVGKGTGMGLTVAYEIVKSHHGEILVESTVAVGSTFTVKLPLTQEGISG